MARKYILTGGPGSGKSSIILDLEQRGYATVREAAKDIIKCLQACGIKEPWKEPDFQERILKLQVEREERISRETCEVFLDRGIIDPIAYTQPCTEIRRKIQKNLRKYDGVFLIENLGHCQQTKIRAESLEQALTIERLLERTYRGLGYEIIRIPPAPLKERTELILKNTERRYE